MEEQNEQSEEITRTIIACQKNHTALSLMKINGNGKFKSIDEVLTYLLAEHEELKALKEKSKKPQEKKKNGRKK